MNSGQFEITVNLTNQKVQFTGVSNFNPERPIKFDFNSPIGDGDGYAGLELLLMSFTGCVATTIVYLLRKMGKDISGFRVNARGVKRDQSPMKIERIFLEFIVNSKDTEMVDIQKSIQLAKESLSPVWQMLKNNVEVTTECKIIQ